MVNQILPIGTDDFKKLRTENKYYVDKTAFITSLLRSYGEVNLFTRPRRFGKTLNMTMLKTFFEIGTDQSLFNGLDISREADLCRDWMGKYPVVYLTLKGVNGQTFDSAFKMLRETVRSEVSRFMYLLDSKELNDYDRDVYNDILDKNSTVETIKISLKRLTELLSKHHGYNVIVLIDEYDVPLDKAYNKGYYDDMIDVIRDMLGEVLKSNTHLKFAVLTGALRISKESIFTGLNNPKVDTISDSRFDEYFGFTDPEVKKILADYDLLSNYNDVREWYDGYHFGQTDVYCPWDVLNYCDKLLADPKVETESHWINSSGNDLVKRFIDKADATTRNEIERLIAGETITKTISQTLTYSELDESIDNLWSVLFMTGYLTSEGMVNGQQKLLIPNREVKGAFIEKIKKWFDEKVKRSSKLAEELCEAFRNGDAKRAEELLNRFLITSISYHDYQAKADEKEAFYHAALLTFLTSGADWSVYSNTESGDGLADLLVESEDLKSGFIVELKYADTMLALEKTCDEAMCQIEEKRYATRLWYDGVESGIAYGVAFFKKRCKVVMKRLEPEMI
jgi:hypothetical protein